MESILLKSDFIKLSSFIYHQSGIKITEAKKVMVEARLRKRLRELKIRTYSEYCDFLFSKGAEKEIIHLVDVITTNKTDFFREPKQFVFMNDTALPSLISLKEAGLKKPLKVWSAGCSTGEEPYTAAMVINEFGEQYSGYSFEILATDISTIVLEKALMGIYEEEKIAPIPSYLQKKYLLRSKDKQKSLVRIIPYLRNLIQFQRLNFMDKDFGFKDTFDIIFCRNVIIYFDKETQRILIEKLLRYLSPGGFLFLGHSESIFDNKLPISQMAASTYRKVNETRLNEKD